jgi:hypothetical protein
MMNCKSCREHQANHTIKYCKRHECLTRITAPMNTMYAKKSPGLVNLGESVSRELAYCHTVIRSACATKPSEMSYTY